MVGLRAHWEARRFLDLSVGDMIGEEWVAEVSIL